MTTDTTTADSFEIGLPYARATMDNNLYGVECPECGLICYADPSARSINTIPKSANRAYAVHYEGAHR